MDDGKPAPLYFRQTSQTFVRLQLTFCLITAVHEQDFKLREVSYNITQPSDVHRLLQARILISPFKDTYVNCLEIELLRAEIPCGRVRPRR